MRGGIAAGSDFGEGWTRPHSQEPGSKCRLGKGSGEVSEIVLSPSTNVLV